MLREMPSRAWAFSASDEVAASGVLRFAPRAWRKIPNVQTRSHRLMFCSRGGGAAAVLASAAIWSATPASAQTANESALAESLFRKGRELMDAEQFGAACPKLAESQRLDPNLATQLNLGACYEFTRQNGDRVLRPASRL